MVFPPRRVARPRHNPQARKRITSSSFAGKITRGDRHTEGGARRSRGGLDWNFGRVADPGLRTEATDQERNTVGGAGKEQQRRRERGAAERRRCRRPVGRSVGRSPHRPLPPSLCPLRLPPSLCPAAACSTAPPAAAPASGATPMGRRCVRAGPRKEHQCMLRRRVTLLALGTGHDFL